MMELKNIYSSSDDSDVKYNDKSEIGLKMMLVANYNLQLLFNNENNFHKYIFHNLDRSWLNNINISSLLHNNIIKLNIPIQNIKNALYRINSISIIEYHYLLIKILDINNTNNTNNTIYFLQDDQNIKLDVCKYNTLSMSLQNIKIYYNANQI